MLCCVFSVVVEELEKGLMMVILVIWFDCDFVYVTMLFGGLKFEKFCFFIFKKKKKVFIFFLCCHAIKW
jgi:hypothetical protein